MLEVKNLYKSFVVSQGIFKKEKKQVLKNVSFSISEGECLGLIGESGSGKSTLGKIIMGIEKSDSGEIFFEGENKEQNYRHKTSVVFQDYSSSVNPKFKVIQIISEPLLKFNLPKKEIKEKVIKLLKKVSLKEEFLYRYPHELSGGQLQRVCIARAVSTNPKFILLDEAVSSLDVSVQMQILELLIKLKKECNLSYLFITHDLLTITYICDRILFFKNGEIIEQVDEIENLKFVKEDYSKLLLKNV